MRLFIVSPTLALLFVSTLLAPTRADADYSLTTGTNPSGTGTVRRSPNQATYPAGSEVTLTATPASGFSFLDWSGDASGSTNAITISMDSDKDIYAYFRSDPARLSVSPLTSGPSLTR